MKQKKGFIFPLPLVTFMVVIVTVVLFSALLSGLLLYKKSFGKAPIAKELYVEIIHEPVSTQDALLSLMEMSTVYKIKTLTPHGTPISGSFCENLAGAMGVTDIEGLTSCSFNGDTNAAGVFVSNDIFFPTEGNTFSVLSTGYVSSIPGNPSNFISSDFSPVGASGDTITLTLNFKVPDGANCLAFNFAFLSEEYPEYVGSSYNDFFYALLDGTNIAFDTRGNIINVNNNFFDPSLTPQNSFDGQTVLLTTVHPVTEGNDISLTFQVGDVGDGIYDTAVFLDNLNIGYSENCIPGTTPTFIYFTTRTDINFAEVLTYAVYENYFQNPKIWIPELDETVEFNLPKVAKDYLDFVCRKGSWLLEGKYWLFLYDPNIHDIKTIATNTNPEEFDKKPYGQRASIPIKPENYWLVLYVR